MDEKLIKLAVMFADVVDSTRLYDMQGDVHAKRIISRCMTGMADIIGRHQGKIIKFIGDAMMCQFEDANAAVLAACEVQKASGNADGLISLLVRIGLQYGDVIADEGDVFGDTVNVASRLSSIAGARQIITAEQLVEQLSPENQKNARLFGHFAVKGKAHEIPIYQIVWEPDSAGLTNIMPVLPVMLDEVALPGLQLTHGTIQKTLTPGMPKISMGRSDQCDIAVNNSVASRIHAQIEYRRGKIVLTDVSTNGTYVRTSDNRVLHVHREELILSGKGAISLGKPSFEDSEELIYFKCD
jgi:class 3 adenylate cyclase